MERAGGRPRFPATEPSAKNKLLAKASYPVKRGTASGSVPELNSLRAPLCSLNRGPIA
jgi:hypothetical protein